MFKLLSVLSLFNYVKGQFPFEYGQSSSCDTHITAGAYAGTISSGDLAGKSMILLTGSTNDLKLIDSVVYSGTECDTTQR